MWKFTVAYLDHPLSAPQTVLYALPIALLLYFVSISIYRLYLHPLARFPGPKLTAITPLYEFYYDVVLRGQFTFEIARMHREYGPIVRINPHELHISDPDFYDVLYVGAGTRRTEKYPWSARMFGNPGSMISSVGHELHRMRRQPLNAFFSKAAVTKLEPMIKAKVSKMCERLSRARETGEAVRLGLQYIALTADVITEYSFGQAYDFLDDEGAAENFATLQRDVLEQTLLQRQLGWFLPLMLSMPEWLVLWMNPDLKGFIVYRNSIRGQILQVKANKELVGKEESKHRASGSTYRAPTIFHELLAADIPSSEKALARLEEEAQTVVAAGALTTAHFLEVTTFHILNNPPIFSRVLSELRAIMPDDKTMPSTSELKRLSYFAAVINEGFRMSDGVTSRLTRVSPDQPLQFRNWTIPVGTPVGMTSIIQHRTPELFLDPQTFNPDRFLGEGQKLAKYLVNFNRGTRDCLGMNLARTEIHLVLATLLVRFGTEMELFGTDRSDIDMKHDFFSPFARTDSKGLRVVVKANRKG